MNRIILIGNGFDLAHGLKTSYSDFIDWFWETEAIKIKNENNGIKFEDNYIIVTGGFGTWHFKSGNTDYQDFLLNLKQGGIEITYKNKFLETITEKKYLQNWVDIEEEYFAQLKNAINNQVRPKFIVEKLNQDFDEIKIALEKYLTNEINKSELNSFDLKNIGQYFNIADFNFKGISSLKDECLPKMEEEKVKQFDSYLKSLGNYNLCNTQIYPSKTLLLNFNYTDLPKKLKQCIHTNAWQLDDWVKNTFDHLFIHGQLNNFDYPIIFGYGDEQDEMHKEIEKRGGAYLDNMKTVNYLKSPNYKNMLVFIESGLYQIFIWGHSCGLSDKTMLNTLFEHENCVSIKPFYYTDENGHNNYDDIIKNIYRCFTDKTLMREKVVNKRFCVEL